MDSLLANYASSDEEEESEPRHHQQEKNRPNDSDHPSNPKPSSCFSSLPLPKSSPPPPSYSSSSVFLSLPTPKSDLPNPNPQSLKNPSSSNPGFNGPAKPSSLFSSLPQPKTQNSDPEILSNPSASSNPNPKRVVQFRPPINPYLKRSNGVDEEDEEEDDDDNEKQSKRAEVFEPLSQTPSVKSFLSSIPAPKNSVALGALPSASGTVRRSIVEASLNGVNTASEASVKLEVGNYESQSVDGSSSSPLGVGGLLDYTVGGDSSNWGSASEHYVNYDSYGGYGNDGGDPSNLGPASGDYANYDSYGSNSNSGNYGNYESKWVDRSTAAVAPEMLEVGVESVVKVPGKRGRNDIPQEIIEVKQDELIKNRPREDQVKLTGIAFGPSYQPVSTKGKPTKLHKRKHQIGSLYFDMRQKEMELAERRSKGFLTKAETQAKYGW